MVASAHPQCVQPERDSAAWHIKVSLDHTVARNASAPVGRGVQHEATSLALSRRAALRSPPWRSSQQCRKRLSPAIRLFVTLAQRCGPLQAAALGDLLRLPVGSHFKVPKGVCFQAFNSAELSNVTVLQWIKSGPAGSDAPTASLPSLVGWQAPERKANAGSKQVRRTAVWSPCWPCSHMLSVHAVS